LSYKITLGCKQTLRISLDVEPGEDDDDERRKKKEAEKRERKREAENNKIQ